MSDVKDMDLDQLRREHEELLIRLEKVDKQTRVAGGRNVKISDVSQKDWYSTVRQSLLRVDPAAATDPSEHHWFDVDKFGGTRQKRALFIRLNTMGDNYSGKAPLAANKLNDDVALDKAVTTALAALREKAQRRGSRGDALSVAQRDAAEQRMVTKRLEKRLADLEVLIAKSTSTEVGSSPETAAEHLGAASAPEVSTEATPTTPSTGSTAPDPASVAPPAPADSLAEAVVTELKSPTGKRTKVKASKSQPSR